MRQLIYSNKQIKIYTQKNMSCRYAGELKLTEARLSSSFQQLDRGLESSRRSRQLCNYVPNPINYRFVLANSNILSLYFYYDVYRIFIKLSTRTKAQCEALSAHLFTLAHASVHLPRLCGHAQCLSLSP